MKARNAILCAAKQVLRDGKASLNSDVEVMPPGAGTSDYMWTGLGAFNVHELKEGEVETFAVGQIIDLICFLEANPLAAHKAMLKVDEYKAFWMRYKSLCTKLHID